MRNFFIIWRRELAASFLSPVAYVTTVVFLIAAGATFLAGVFRNAGGSEPLTTLLFNAVLFWLTALIAMVTMRLFAEEKRSGTLEMLMTAPATESEVVLGKYAGALSFVAIVVAPAVCTIFLLEAMSPGIDSIDVGAFFGGCLMLLLIAGLGVALGLLASLATNSQIVAGICAFCLIWFVLLFGWLVSLIPSTPQSFSDYLSLNSHLDDFSRGLIDTRPIVLYVSATAWLLFTAIRSLESRRWR
jgi:ABC-2 type transport system permease protein